MPGKRTAWVEVSDGQSEEEAKAAHEQAERDRAGETDGSAGGQPPRPGLTVEPVDDLPGSPPADDVSQFQAEGSPPPPPPPKEAPARAFGRKKRGLAKPAYEEPRARPIASTDQSEASLASTARAASGAAGEEAAAETAAAARRLAGQGLTEKPASNLPVAGEEDVELSRIRKSPTNPRIKFEEIVELADSIRKGGVYHAVLLRPNSTLGGYEIVDGERRVRAVELNAEKHGGPKHVRAVVRPLSDQEFDEIRLDANLQRKDLKPAEEAEGFQRLHKAHGMKYPEIAVRLGLKPRVVYNRVQLLSLGPAGRKALDAGEFGQSVMLEVSRRPTHSVQEEMLRELRNRSISTLEAAEELFRVHFAFDLASAPFDKDDPFLAQPKTPCTGPCKSCPHNSSNQAQLELGGKPPRAGVCTSPDGYRGKRDAHVEREKERSKTDGVEWLKPAEVKRAFEGGRELVPNGPYVSQDAAVPDHPRRATWRSLLKEDMPKLYAAPDAGGRVHRLLDRAEAVARARKLGTLGKEQADEASRDEAKELQKRRQADAREAAAALKVVEAAVAAAEKELALPMLRLLCLVLIDAMKTGPVEKRRGRQVEHLTKDLAKMKEPQLRGLLVELCFSEYGEYFTPELLALAKVLGLRREKLEKEVEQAELALAAAKGKGREAPAPVKPRPAAKRGAAE